MIPCHTPALVAALSVHTPMTLQSLGGRSGVLCTRFATERIEWRVLLLLPGCKHYLCLLCYYLLWFLGAFKAARWGVGKGKVGYIPRGRGIGGM